MGVVDDTNDGSGSQKRNSGAVEKTMDAMTPEENESDEETRCGFGSWSPDWLQKFASPKLFFFFFSIAGLLEGAQFTYIAGALSTLEKRFSYDTKTSGFILITEEFGPICFGILIGYFGGKTHRPRIMAIGMLLGCLSNFVMALPYFIYGAGRLDESVGLTMSRFYGIAAQFCDKGFNEAEKDCSSSVTVPVILLLVLGIVLKGIGNNIFYTIGTPYIDDSVKKKNSPFYLGILFALRFVGPALGYVLSSISLQFYENPLHDPGFGPDDPRWIGAWWIGFIFLGCSILVFSVPILLFPRRFAGSPKSSPETEAKRETPLQQIKNMGKAIKRLGKNPILVIHYLGGVLRLNGFLGYYLLLPKYTEMQFKQSASKASLYTGPVSVVGMQVGIILGGYIIRRFRPGAKVMTGGIFVTEMFAVVAMLICMFLTCPSYQLTGTTTLEASGFQLENACNKDCMCSTEAYTPVCGPDGISSYFNPCYAGCTSYNKTDDTMVYNDCRCVHDSAGMITIGDANEHLCDSACQWMITFIVILTIGKLISSIAKVPEAIVMLRCVDPEDKCLTFGVLSTVFSILGFIPYAMIYGALTDSSCLVWEEKCGKTGNCWIYDTDKLRLLLHGVSAAFMILGCVGDLLIWILSSRLKNLYEEEDKQMEDEFRRVSVHRLARHSIGSFSRPT